MDAGFPVRLRHPPVRRHRRPRIPGDRPRADRLGDGAAPHPHRRPRPRLQQRQHLRQPAAPDAGRPHPGERLGAPLLRTGAEMLGRRAGLALVAHVRWRRLYLLLQRPALAVRRHHPLRPRAGGGPPARARADGRERPADFAARPRPGPRPRYREVFRLLRRRPRRLRRLRPHRPRERVQHQRRQLPLPELPAGLLAVQHLDARAGLGDVRIRRAARIPRHPARSAGDASRSSSAPPAPPAISTSPTPRPTAFRTGTPARPASTGWATGAPRRPTPTIRTSRWTVPPPPSARRACCGLGTA